MATQSSILAQRTPWTQEPGRLQSLESKKSDTTERLTATRENKWSFTKAATASETVHTLSLNKLGHSTQAG